jgi:hypothetical protein
MDPGIGGWGRTGLISNGVRIDTEVSEALLGPKFDVPAINPDALAFPFPKLLGIGIPIPDDEFGVFDPSVDH